jgi:hypothetical protein
MPICYLIKLIEQHLPAQWLLEEKRSGFGFLIGTKMMSLGVSFESDLTASFDDCGIDSDIDISSGRQQPLRHL